LNAVRLFTNALNAAVAEGPDGKLKPHISDLLVQRCHVYLALKKNAEAYNDILKAVELSPNSGEVCFRKTPQEKFSQFL
jgi:hypothetical protein